MAYEPFNEGPVMEQKDNWVSFNFHSATGYDRIDATVHGDLEFVAKAFAIDNFNGKISTLMSKAIEVDSHFKKNVRLNKQAGDATQGKA